MQKLKPSHQWIQVYLSIKVCNTLQYQCLILCEQISFRNTDFIFNHRLNLGTSLSNTCSYLQILCERKTFDHFILILGFSSDFHQVLQLHLTLSWPSETQTPRCCFSGRSPKRKMTSWDITFTTVKLANKPGRLLTTNPLLKPGDKDRFLNIAIWGVFWSSRYSIVWLAKYLQ